MNQKTLLLLVNAIVYKASALKEKLIFAKSAPVNYACIFSQNNTQYNEFVATAAKMGKLIRQTSTGPIFRTPTIKTCCGDLQLLKIRKPDPSRPELGDADFTVKDYSKFKKKYLDKPGFKLIQRENFEMMEFFDGKDDVRVYFSNPPLQQQLGNG